MENKEVGGNPGRTLPHVSVPLSAQSPNFSLTDPLSLLFYKKSTLQLGSKLTVSRF